MKKILSIFVVVCCLLSIALGVVACSDNDWNNGNLKIVTTIFPEYDWTLNVVGQHADEVNIRNLLNSSVDMHSYQPSVADVASIVSCDLFIYVGGESDDWVEGALKQATNKNMIVIKLLDVIADSALDEEHKEGMQEDDDDEEDGALDEHVWLSLKRAELCENAITNALKQLNSDNADDYEANAKSYCQQLANLDTEYVEALSTATNKTLIVADRFPFRYLFSDYGLDYFAAYSGCSAAIGVNFETINFLVKKVNELSAKVLIETETGDGQLPQSIITNSQNKNIKVLTLNSLQSVNAKDRENGITYLSLMTSNLDVLREATK